MRVALLFALAGCGASPASDGGVGDGPLTDGGAPDLVEGLCTPDCPPCDVGAICIPGGPVHAACLSPCHTTADCPNGLECAVVFDVGGYLPPGSNPPVCLSTQLPAACIAPGGFFCTDTEGMTSCLDDMRLETGFVWTENQVCGAAITACPNGCERLDMGFPPVARCR